jgi:FkbM family methyltransferase
VAFDPDPINLGLLQKSMNGDPRVSIQPFGVGARKETLRFAVAGPGSHVSQDGACEVQIITLDEALRDVAPTYIKFDIEGSELDALEGGKETIKRRRPKLAVCVYHAPDHLWRIPLRLRELLPDSP